MTTCPETEPEADLRPWVHSNATLARIAREAGSIERAVHRICWDADTHGNALDVADVERVVRQAVAAQLHELRDDPDAADDRAALRALLGLDGPVVHQPKSNAELVALQKSLVAAIRAVPYDDMIRARMTIRDMDQRNPYDRDVLLAALAAACEDRAIWDACAHVRQPRILED